MSTEHAINNDAVRALFEVSSSISELATLVEFGPYQLTDETKAENFGSEVIRRLREVRLLALKHTRDLAQSAGVPSPVLMSALDASLEGAFKGLPKGH